MLSPAVVSVPGIDWSEHALVWLCINMPTSSTKSALYQYLHTQHETLHGYWVMQPARKWETSWQLLGLYDELSTFLT